MVRITAQGNTKEYGVIEFVADTDADLTKIDTSTCSMGSTCLIVETSSVYMLGGDGQWHVL